MAEPKTATDTKPQRSAEELRKALQTCEIQKREVQAKKKSVVGSYNDAIKDIDAEIGDILAQLKELETPKV